MTNLLSIVTPPRDLAFSNKLMRKSVPAHRTLCGAVLAAAFVASGFCSGVQAASKSDGRKWFKAAQPIKDAQGRIRYIVTLEVDDTPKAKAKF